MRRHPRADSVPRIIRGWRLWGLASLLLLGGCSSLAYYQQAASGQWQLAAAARPVEAVQRDPATPEALRDRLAVAREIRAHAARIGLPATGSYERYADLERPFVVWNVVATPALSLQPRQWCFPVAGCVAYRGYFREADARMQGKQLAAAGDDVHVGGVQAYSTLGWFHDPLLNTFIHRDDGELARLLFHELAHRLLYVPGDTRFNESYAEAVAVTATGEWLRASGRLRQLAAFEQAERRQQALEALLDATRRDLHALYASGLDDATKRRDKIAILAVLQRRYEDFRQHWQYHGYDGWMRHMNNARLAATESYQRWVPVFQSRWQGHAGDWRAYLGEIETLAGQPPRMRETTLLAWEREYQLAGEEGSSRGPRT